MDATYMLVLADTHVGTLEQLPARLTELVKEIGWVVHCGDFTSIRVVEELRSLSTHFIGVYGNTDGEEIRRHLPAETTFEVHGKKIAVFHPYWGGPPWGLVDELVERYRGMDVVLFGHTHDSLVETKNGTLLLNPGQGYPMFITPASVGILKVTPQEVTGRVFALDKAELF